MHALRLAALTISLCALCVWWVFHYRFEWVAKLDVWAVEKYLEEPVGFLEAGVETPWRDSETLAETAEFLEGLEPLQHGDRHYKPWLALTEKLVDGLVSAGDLDGAIAWQTKVFESHPQNLEQTLLWTQLLVERGGDQDRVLARAELESLRHRFPDWAGPLLVLLKLNVAQGLLGPETRAGWDLWKVLAGRGMAADWRWYYWVQGQKEVHKSELVDATLVETAGDRGRYELRLQIPAGADVRKVRLDPLEERVGSLVDISIAAELGSGERQALGIKAMLEGEWVRGSDTIRLTGEIDPKVMFDKPPAGTVAVVFSFRPEAQLPGDLVVLFEAVPFEGDGPR